MRGRTCLWHTQNRVPYRLGRSRKERNETMWSRLKSGLLAACLFVFLFVVVGASLHLKPMGAFLAATSGSFLVIHGVNRWGGAGPSRQAGQRREIDAGLTETYRKYCRDQ